MNATILSTDPDLELSEFDRPDLDRTEPQKVSEYPSKHPSRPCRVLVCTLSNQRLLPTGLGPSRAPNINPEYPSKQSRSALLQIHTCLRLTALRPDRISTFDRAQNRPEKIHQTDRAPKPTRKDPPTGFVSDVAHPPFPLDSPSPCYSNLEGILNNPFFPTRWAPTKPFRSHLGSSILVPSCTIAIRPYYGGGRLDSS